MKETLTKSIHNNQIKNAPYLDCIEHDRDDITLGDGLSVPLALAFAPVPQFTIIEGPAVLTIAKSL